jgi:hypothetical protein
MRIKKALLLLSLSSLLTSCHPGTKVEIVNNTGQNLTVVSLDTVLKETLYPVASNQTVRIKVPYKLQVRLAGEIWNYDFPSTPLPQRFRERIGGNWYLEEYQLEKDGSLYVLLPGTQAPTSDLPQQPTGYPIRPR